MNKNIKKYFCLGVVLLLMFNCTRPVDFNQADDLVLEPVLESSLVFYTASAEDFFVGGSEQSTAEDFAEIDFFNNSFIQDHLIKVEFVFQIENSINRAYRLSVSFLDTNGQILETFDVNTEASSNNQVIPSEHIETFEDVSLQRVKQTRVLVFSLTMLPGTPINENTPGVISVKSKGILFLNID